MEIKLDRREAHVAIKNAIANLEQHLLQVFDAQVDALMQASLTSIPESFPYSGTAGVALSAGQDMGKSDLGEIQEQLPDSPFADKDFGAVPSRKSSHNINRSVTKVAMKMHENDEARTKKAEGFHEVAFAVLVICNTIYVAYETSYVARYKAELPHQFVVKSIFCVIFVGEMALRGIWQKSSFIKRPYRAWNAFDLVMVFTMSVEVVFIVSLRVSTFRVLRLFRIARVLRVFPLLGRMGDYAPLMRGILRACVSLLPVALLGSSLTLIVGILLTDAALDACRSPDANPVLCTHFGTLESSILSLYKAVFGGMLWGELMDGLEAIHLLDRLFYILYVSFSVIVITNVVTAHLLCIAHRAARREKEFLYDEEMKDTKENIMGMLDLFRKFDTNQSGTLCLNEFEHALQIPKMQAFLSALRLEIDDMRDLFGMLDEDESGAISAHEFVLGCLRLRGEARQIDMVKVQVSNRFLLQKVSMLKRKMDNMDNTIRALPHLNSRSGIPMNPEEHGNAIASCVQPLDEIRGSIQTATAGMLAKIPTAVPEMTECAVPKEDCPQGENSAAKEGLGPPGSYSRGQRRPSTKLSDNSLRQKFSQQMTGSAITVEDEISAVLRKKMKPKSTISRPEERAMTVSELRDVCTVVKARCTQEQWMDPWSGTDVQPNYVNLYHLTHYLICPMTVPEDIIINGLYHSEYNEGQIVQQVDGCFCAVGVIKQDCVGSQISVLVLRGRFVRSIDITVDDEDAGIPSEVEAKGAISYKELVSSGPSKPRWYSSHWWGESVLNFVADCEEHTKRRELCAATSTYWVCGYALRQYSLGVDVSVTSESAFRAALREAEGVLLHLDPEATPFQRIWCDFEIYSALSANKLFDIVTSVCGGRVSSLLSEDQLPHEAAMDKTIRESKFPINLLVKGMHAKLENGSCTVASDKEQIFDFIASVQPGETRDDTILESVLRDANAALNGKFARAVWPQAMRRGSVRQLSLPEVLQADEGLQILSLSFAHFEEVNEAEMASLGKGVPPNVSEIQLSFENCPNVTNQGMHKLVKHLPPGLRRLRLDFLGCKRITDDGVDKLVRHFPAELEEVRLDFAFCELISAMSLQSLSDNLPKGLRKFRATFRGTGIGRDFESLADLRGFISGDRNWRQKITSTLFNSTFNPMSPKRPHVNRNSMDFGKTTSSTLSSSRSFERESNVEISEELVAMTGSPQQDAFFLPSTDETQACCPPSRTIAPPATPSLPPEV